MMAGIHKEPGPTARRVAEAVRRIRRGPGQDITTAELSRRLAALGQPIPDTGITKTEQGTRRVDVDDLVALALALGVTPNTLLLPQVNFAGGAGARYELTPQAPGTAEDLWRWAQGEYPPLILADGAETWLGDVEHPMVGFAIRNRPYLTAPRPAAPADPAAEAALRELGSAVLKAMHAGAAMAEVRRAVELTMALPVIMVTDEFRERLRRRPAAGEAS